MFLLFNIFLGGGLGLIFIGWGRFGIVGCRGWLDIIFCIGWGEFGIGVFGYELNTMFCIGWRGFGIGSCRGELYMILYSSWAEFGFSNCLEIVLVEFGWYFLFAIDFFFVKFIVKIFDISNLWFWFIVFFYSN